MRAIRFVEARRLDLVEIPDPEPGQGEVVVRVAACGICGSDLSCYKAGVFSGAVFGHEFSGTIAALGADVPGWREGDAVAVDPKIPCGACDDCRAGAEHRCPHSLTRGIGAERDGGLAEYVRAPATLLHRLPPQVPVEDGCLVEPLSVAIHGIERAGVRAGEPALVTGLGPIGLLAIAALRARGAGEIIGVDPVGARRDLAAALGAQRVYPPGGEALAAAQGVPLVAECSGRAEQIQQACNVTAPGGRVLLLGVPMTEASIIPMVWITREINMIGSISSTVDDFRAAVSLLADQTGIARIVTRRISLEEVPGAFDELISGAPDGKIAVAP